jgi:hypothetical protein
MATRSGLSWIRDPEEAIKDPFRDRGEAPVKDTA